MTERLYKVLGLDDRPLYGSDGWYLPEGNFPGEWMPPVEGVLTPCQNGYHLCRPQDLPFWLGPRIYLAEYRGESLDEGDKIVVRQARLLRRLDTWNMCSARLLACDWAERTLPLYERHGPNDGNLRLSIGLSRQLAEDPDRALDSRVMRPIAWAAAWEAAWAVAWETKQASAQFVVWDAAWAMAWAASWHIIRAFSWAVSRDNSWDIAWAMAKETAWEVARTVSSNSATDISRPITKPIVWTASRNATWAANKTWQIQRLLQFLHPEEA